jgi:hypothetical protein
MPTRPALRDELALLNRHLRYPFPPISQHDLERLDAGKLVRFRVAPTPTDPKDRAIALRITTLPRAAVWNLDHRRTLPGQVRPRRAADPQHRAGHAVWMGLLALPFPFDDRAWVVETHINPGLVAATDGRAWERWWDLREDHWDEVLSLAGNGSLAGVTRPELEAAAFTPTNEGTWFYDELPDGRLLVGFAEATVVGGVIPTDVLTHFIVGSLDDLVDGTFDRAANLGPAALRRRPRADRGRATARRCRTTDPRCGRRSRQARLGSRSPATAGRSGQGTRSTSRARRRSTPAGR